MRYRMPTCSLAIVAVIPITKSLRVPLLKTAAYLRNINNDRKWRKEEEEEEERE